MRDKKQHIRKLMQQGNYTEALKLCEKMCQSDKTDAESYYILGSIYGKTGDYRNAVVQFNKVITLKSNAYVAHDGLGAAYYALGDYQAAEKAFRDSLAIQPDNIGTLIKLGYILGNKGKISESEECLQHALELDPSSVDTLDALGNIRYQQELYHEAISYYVRAIKSNPERIDAHLYMGNSLLRLGKSDRAVVSFNKVLSLDPRNLDALIHLGHALKSVGESSSARKQYQVALEIEPDNLIAVTGLADIYEKEGDFEKAYDLLLPLIRQNRASCDIAAAFVRLCHRFNNCDEAINYALNVLDQDTIAKPDRANLEFALGRRYDHQAQFDQAFLHYQLANEASQHTFNPQSHAVFIDALIQVHNIPFFTRAPRSETISSRPVFIVGMPRSGTSLVEQILATHPQVYGAGELTHISDAVLSINMQGGAGSQYPYNLEAIDKDVLNKITNSYLGHLDSMDDRSIRVTDKYPANFFHLGLISLAFPNARVIHCTRDPRDTCLSIYFQCFSDAFSFANRLEDIAFYYCQYRKLMQHYKNVINMPIMDVAYEDLVQNQEQVSRRLIDFIGLEWDDQCLRYYENKRFVATPSYDQVREKIYSNSIGRWKNYEDHLQPLLNALENG